MTYSTSNIRRNPRSVAPGRRGRAAGGALAGLALSAGGLFAGPPPEKSPASGKQPDERPSFEAQVDRYLEPYLDTGNFSGTVLLARGGKILLSKGYGFADVERQVPNTPRSVFRLASISRVFTSAAIVLLEQQAKLSVEDKLAKYLPGFPNGDRITIHHLLTLSAGLPNINTLPGYDRWSETTQTPESLVEKFRDLELEFAPGEKTVHSNSNYNVLALVIEKVSGRSYGGFLQQELLGPLKMTQTAHEQDPERKIPHLSVGLAPTGLAGLVAAPTLDWSVKTGNGSIHSTVEDLLRFDRALATNTLFEAPAVRKLFTEHFPSNGYGFFVREIAGMHELYINGRSPGYGGYWGRLAEPDVTAIVLGNIYNSVSTQIGRDLIRLAVGHQPDPPSFRPDPPDPQLLDDVVGTYQFGPDFYRANGQVVIRKQDGHLFSRADWLMPAGGMKFIHRVYGSDLEFRRGPDGKVTELQFDDYVGKRVD